MVTNRTDLSLNPGFLMLAKRSTLVSSTGTGDRLEGLELEGGGGGGPPLLPEDTGGGGGGAGPPENIY